MDKFPDTPDSAMVSRHENDIFVSFHWHFNHDFYASSFSLVLTDWVEKALRDMGAEDFEEYGGGLNE